MSHPKKSGMDDITWGIWCFIVVIVIVFIGYHTNLYILVVLYLGFYAAALAVSVIKRKSATMAIMEIAIVFGIVIVAVAYSFSRLSFYNNHGYGRRGSLEVVWFLYTSSIAIIMPLLRITTLFRNNS
jgi:hypothetical protein